MSDDSELPEGWSLATLPEVACITMGQSPPGSAFNDRGDGLPFFQGKTDFGERYPTVRIWSTESRKIANVGDILLSVRAPVGPTNVADMRCVIGRGLAALTPEGGIPAEFLLFAIRLQESELSLSGVGSTFTAIGKGDLQQLEMLLPPLAEQYRIVAKVDQLLERVNSARDRLRSVPAILKRFRQSVLAAACSGRLTADWRDEHSDEEPAAVMLEQLVARRGAQLGLWLDQDDGTAPLELPESWAWSTLGTFLSRIEAGKSFLCVERPPMPSEAGVVKVSAVSWGHFREAESKTCTDPGKVDETLFVRPGDFLFSRANTIELVGACVIAEHVERNVMLSDKILRLHFDEIDPFWVLHVLRSRHGRTEIERLATGNQQAMRNIAQGSIRQIRVPVPPLAEQREIVRRVEALLALADGIAQRRAAATILVERLTQAILAKAFRGELVPTEAELARSEGRDYETAEALLERISKSGSQVGRTRMAEKGVLQFRKKL